MSIKYKGKTISGGGSDFTTDSTLTMSEGNVLGVSTPVNGVISQKDFDALPDEKQKRGVYFIPGAGGCGSSQEIYSNDETVIGRWIDGRPLYRKVVVTKGPTKAGTSDDISIYDFKDIIPDHVIISGHIVVTLKSDPGIGDMLPLNFFSTTSYYIFTFYRRTDNSIKMGVGNQAYTNADVILILEYTKTTDEVSV